MIILIQDLFSSATLAQDRIKKFIEENDEEERLGKFYLTLARLLDLNGVLF